MNIAEIIIWICWKIILVANYFNKKNNAAPSRQSKNEEPPPITENITENTINEETLKKNSEKSNLNLEGIPMKDQESIKDALHQVSSSFPPGSDMHYLVIYMGEKEMEHVNSLSRYYELNPFHLFARGMWLLTLLREAQLNGKELAIVAIDDESQEVSQYLKINPY